MAFYRDLELPSLPEEVEPLLPFREKEVIDVMQKFYDRYYNDQQYRVLLFGINPGRFGAGITGLGFTDPVQLQNVCGIEHPFAMRPETSSVFIYEMIEAFGGPTLFYRHFHFSAVSPVGFVTNGKNFNYYDTPEVMEATRPFIVETIRRQLKMPVRSDVAFSVGKGKNFEVLQKLNDAHGFFDRIEALPHPRWVMQYRYRRKPEFVEQYVQRLGDAAL